MHERCCGVVVRRRAAERAARTRRARVRTRLRGSFLLRAKVDVDRTTLSVLLAFIPIAVLLTLAMLSVSESLP